MDGGNDADAEVNEDARAQNCVRPVLVAGL